MTKIFVSHHHSDKALLARVKAWLKHYGITLFLAHDDIEVGKIDHEAIREGIIGSDAFFVYGSEAAMKSPACNQEIGMAMVLGKPTIWALAQGNRPWGVMPPRQGIIIKSGDEDEVAGVLFCNLLTTIEKTIRPDSAKEQKDATDKASIDIFTIWEDEDKYLSDSGVVTLTPYNRYHPDIAFMECIPTLFRLYHAGTGLGFVRIVCAGQSAGQPTEKFLPTKFPFLGKDYLSKIEFNEGCNKRRQKALSLLLNDISDNIELARNFKDESALNILLEDDDETKRKIEGNDDDGFGDMEDIPF